ncbi:TAXI family TRAP transporter solute-binding subunit [Methylocapsa palsarum]|uniref:TRAP transporter solute receptor, TAXI family n=1 Tax=Methylocapsa palsarum TaxID=1612308 RepID=A0A1I3YES6_9HYPH|nr:TAXI family TRAP transporter solute-binding subunit [Methylocapsa palsarum]SFK30358.1 TRAP transporter solute receptor, TAXI family [Methylocapsa palsarum]
MNVARKSARNALICLFFLLAPFQCAQAEKGFVGDEQKKRETNDIAVTVVVSGLSCTCARFAEDIRNVVNDLRPNGLRVLPVLGVGGLQNVDDVLFLKGIDMGVVDEDNLRLVKKKDPYLYANIEKRIQYITKLYNSEFHVLARDEIRSYDDLRGKKVNFNLRASQTEVSAEVIFNALKIDVERTNYDNDEAIKKLEDGDIAAMIVLSGAPQAALAKVKKEDKFHFLSLDHESLPDHDLSAIASYYLPAELTHEEYPNLIAEGQSVPTVANRALLVAYAWPEDSQRYKKLAKFVQEFFGKIDQFHSAARHPKWSEINLSAEIPSWTRFKPAADWLAAHQSVASLQTDGVSANHSSEELKAAFERFIENYAATSRLKTLSPLDREKAFAQFMNYVQSQKTGQPAH